MNKIFYTVSLILLLSFSIFAQPVLKVLVLMALDMEEIEEEANLIKD
ncbi:hypothetical protein OFR34_10020 [Brachyspira hyodysenteriae]|nr:hypothetical protein [Brachyspira hyodysenteriae]MCZ9891922.1 hypothetical protein [Brachyspira hyodysenteriae]MDA0001270.1 hypothetical protein [Brachyspira hyodysenteriae]